MIDLHSHILPGIDDGAKDLETSLEMARIAVETGTKVLACTPHIMPPTYPNTAEIIYRGVQRLQMELDQAAIPLKLLPGADIHIASDMVEGLKAGRLPTLNGTSYFLFEPPHHILPPNLVQFTKKIIEAGYKPVLTHPERLGWVESHYELFCELDKAGLPIQITGGSITGQFGKKVQNLTLRMLQEDRVDIVASDAHNLTSRNPDLSAAYRFVESEFGIERAVRLFKSNAVAMLRDTAIAPRTSEAPTTRKKKGGFLGKLLG